MKDLFRILGPVCLALVVCFACATEDDDDDDQAADQSEFSAAVDGYEPTGDDDSADDDTTDDDDDPDIPPATPNPNAKADAFKLFYKERSARINLSHNRFAIAGDTAAATTFGKVMVAKQGNEYEIVPGPNDNNQIGFSAYTTWKLYQALGTRELELSLIRQFEGLAFNEAVTGHSGITVREALPGWTRIQDGVNKTVTRTRFGVPFDPPTVFDPALETEIIETFFDGLIFTYRENPEEYYFNFKPVDEVGGFSHTFVFSPLPDILFISNCCSSWMKTPQGIWDGAYWANHNSRDNFTDYVQGYLAAFEAEQTAGLPADLALAASHAADAARRTGDRIADDGYILMTSDEHNDYNDLVPAGQVRPDGTTEWQDLGSISSCQMVYAAKAISSEGLRWPVPELPLPGAIETSAFKLLFEMLGIQLPPPALTCKSLDDAFIGVGWGEFLYWEVLGFPWYELAEMLSSAYPDLLFNLLNGMMDDFQELVLGSVNIAYYAQIIEDDELYTEAKRTLNHLAELQRILARLIYHVTNDPLSRTALVEKYGETELERLGGDGREMLYHAAIYARMFDIDWPMEAFEDFAMGHSRNQTYENYLNKPDTTYHPLMTDQDIYDEVERQLVYKEPWIQQRYRDRFGYAPPVRRTADGYEAIGPDGQWMETENSRHYWVGGLRLWFEAPLCIFSPKTLDCSWAGIGCGRVDLDGSKLVDEADRAVFDAAWAYFGEGAVCTVDNSWCGGADLDQSGALDNEDQQFLDAAMGCWI